MSDLAIPPSAADAGVSPRPWAVLCAMHEELHRLVGALAPGARTRMLGGRTVHLGRLDGQHVVLARSGIGKVAAAATTAIVLGHFAPRALVFSGVAGGLGDGVRVGDLVVATDLLQHDLDVSPLFPRWEVPLSGRSRFPADAALAEALASAAAAALESHDADEAARRAALGITVPRLHRGLIVSGDRFVATATESDALRSALPDALAVEMEGAAAAQVAADFGCPLAVVRAVSDRADDAAQVDFGRFVADHASRVGETLVRTWLRAQPR
jgi:adenosylhomocysteine nucleosidase